MHPLQNGSQVTERPANKPVSGLPGYFTESGENNVPSYPGADWFNHVIDEFQNLLLSQNIQFDPTKDDHLAKALLPTVNIATIKSLTESSLALDNYRSVKINSYHEGFNAVYSAPSGGGDFVWRSDLPKSLHDGGVYIDPTKAFPTDFSNSAQLASWFTSVNSGNGVFVRQFSGEYAVQWYGAIEGGYDNTAVFNAVTQAHLDYSEIIRKRITCYGVKFTVLGTVYLRLGQSFDGKGSRLYMGSTGSIKVGFNSSGVKDSGGHPPFLMNLWCEGGYNPIDVNVSGYFVLNTFFSLPVAPVLIKGIDGFVSGMVIDNASVGMGFGASNTTVIGVDFYRCQTQLKFDTCRASTFVGGHFNYADVVGVLVDNLSSPTEKQIKGIKFADCKFRLNAQNANFDGFVKAEGSAISGDITFVSCDFINGKNAAVNNQSTSSNLTLDFDDCTFDGKPAISTETPSDTFYVYEHGSNARAVVNFRRPKIRNTFDVPFKISGIEVAMVDVSGPEFNGIDADYCFEYSNTNGLSVLSISDVTGDGTELLNHVSNAQVELRGKMVECFELKTISGRDYFSLPAYGSTLIDVTLSANRNPAGSTQYRMISKDLISQSYNFIGGSVVTQATIMNQFMSTSDIGDLDITLDIDSLGSGLVRSNANKKSSLLVSTSDAYGNQKISVNYIMTNG
ncbi:hypothetical protein [Vibrio parahaemolyticus]|uniref:hypothetical protein n=1 Tax=Vibrio parahaemolyticus TaxID=670 RepID=UPI00215C5455|nr:hypothetical protein [Vibrio parahaemolyticus]MCR9668509.1 hypothetical protein [Vibrio parahaemolyticus]MCR9823349.1 hypothetical protein [Vibrio parahaemolyticus]